jgi:cold shock CspA family protein
VQLVGKILWWNDRDGFGVLEDADGNEFYFDSSVTFIRGNQVLKRNMFVAFHRNPAIKDCACAYKVKIANATERKIAETRFDNRQLRLSPQA